MAGNVKADEVEMISGSEAGGAPAAFNGRSRRIRKTAESSVLRALESNKQHGSSRSFASSLLVPSTSERKCQFCGCSEDDERLYGRLLSARGVSVHYFCMLFSSALSQDGADEEGILGFLPDDILKEIKRGKKLKCVYCRVAGATIGCVNKKCRKVFHFGCGRNNGALNQYFGTYSTFCIDHRPQQSVPVTPSDRLSFHGTGMITCPICASSVETRASNTTLRAPCCVASSSAWYHRDCIQEMALSSGLHFIRCPLCNDRDRFVQEMLELGIYIPDRDAAWEVENGAFADLHASYNRCDMQPKCACPKGRDYKGGEGSRWEIFLCMTCGGSGIHLECYKESGPQPPSPVIAMQRRSTCTAGRKRAASPPPAVTWNCATCSSILLKGESDRTLRSRQQNPAPDSITRASRDISTAIANDPKGSETTSGEPSRGTKKGSAGGVRAAGCSFVHALQVAAGLPPPVVLVTDVAKSKAGPREPLRAAGVRGTSHSSSDDTAAADPVDPASV